MSSCRRMEEEGTERLREHLTTLSGDEDSTLAKENTISLKIWRFYSPFFILLLTEKFINFFLIIE